MPGIDRRIFLQGAGVLAADAIASKLQAHGSEQSSEHPANQGEMLPPPVYEPFVWNAPGIIFAFEFLDKRLRFRTLLPEGVSAPKDLPAPTAVSGAEVSLQCTGEDPGDHRGLKLTIGSPGSRLVFLGTRETATPTGKRFTIYQADPALNLRVESIYESFRNVPVVRRSTRVTNTGSQSVGIESLSSAMLNNFAPPREFEQQLRVHFALHTRALQYRPQPAPQRHTSSGVALRIPAIRSAI
jgi:hypothetical protein